MPTKEDENNSGESSLSGKIIAITTVVVALTGLITALVHFRDSIPWLTPVASIEVAPNPLNLAIGDKFQVVATVRDSNKNPLEKKVTWSSANPGLVEIDSKGIVTGNAAGDTTITASTGFINSLIPVHVRHINVAAVDVFPPATTMQVDDHLTFDATPYDSEGNSLIGRPILWASDNPGIASVDRSSGDTTGKSAGTVKVTVKSEGKFNAAMVTVNPKPAPPPIEQPPAPQPPTPTPTPAPAPASTPIFSRSSARLERVPTGAVSRRVTAAAPPIAAMARISPVPATVSRAMALAVAGKSTIVNGVQYGGCPASIRILIGETLINVKSDPQEAVHLPLGDQPYNLHGTVSCANQNVAVVNGHGTIGIVNGKTYRCVWRQKGPKDFEIALLPQ
ncbi:MAG: hypothetical protein QOC81_3726 [Thermoanaerobaculia bacterium]|jgi:hypothetical protein|nr:hypothetical protein [Thermoanaerobaculia bacterium]